MGEGQTTWPLAGGLPTPCVQIVPESLPGVWRKSLKTSFLWSLCCVTEAQGKPVMCADHITEGEPGPQAPFSKPRGHTLFPYSPGNGTTSLSWERATATHPTWHTLSRVRLPPGAQQEFYGLLSSLSCRKRNGRSQRSSDSWNP